MWEPDTARSSSYLSLYNHNSQKAALKPNLTEAKVKIQQIYLQNTNTDSKNTRVTLQKVGDLHLYLLTPI